MELQCNQSESLRQIKKEMDGEDSRETVLLNRLSRTLICKECWPSLAGLSSFPEMEIIDFWEKSRHQAPFNERLCFVLADGLEN